MIDRETANWTLSLRAAALLAIDPFGLGGAVLRGPCGPARDVWLAHFRQCLPFGTPWRRMPAQTGEGRLLGGLDLADTLAAGRPVYERGLLAEADGGALVAPMAERLSPMAAGLVAMALDTGSIAVERDGLSSIIPAQFCALFLDEGRDDEHIPPALAERVGLFISLDGLSTARQQTDSQPHVAELGEARRRLKDVVVTDAAIEALSATGPAFGVPSLRLATLALRTAKVAAALAGRTHLSSDDLEIAAALVFAPRATRLPAPPDEQTPEAEEPPPEPSESEQRPCDATDPSQLVDSVVDATRAAIPPDLLALLTSEFGSSSRSSAGGRAGSAVRSLRRGRPTGVRRGEPSRGARLAIVDTLRAAAPWQQVRRRLSGPTDRIIVRREDFRIKRFKDRRETVTIFVVDASGSAALHRLAEVKGAVELILAECYVRRDGVALIAFRGSRAEILLPPTRSLARAKRALAGQVGGGGTPLASALDATALLAESLRRRGQTPLVVLLTDGKANVNRAGQGGRAAAEADVRLASGAYRLASISSLLIDIAPRPSDGAARLASAICARYLPLPYSDAASIAHAVRTVAPDTRNA